MTAETLKDAIRAETAADSRIMSDGLNSYTGVGAEFAGGHGVIDHNRRMGPRRRPHSDGRMLLLALQARDHGLLPPRLPQAPTPLPLESDFRWDRRKQPDAARFIGLVQSVAGKRLFYRTPKGERAACGAT